VRYTEITWFARTPRGASREAPGRSSQRGLNVGAQLAYEGGRLASESDSSSNKRPGHQPGASFGLHIECGPKARRDPGHDDRARATLVDGRFAGAQGDCASPRGVYGGGAITAAGIHTGTWANSNEQSFYGITPAQFHKPARPTRRKRTVVYDGGSADWGVDSKPEWIVVAHWRRAAARRRRAQP